MPLKPTILVIGYVWPEPDSSAAGSHMLSLLRLFKQYNWRVIFSTPAQKTDFSFNLAMENLEEKAIEINNSSFDTYVSKLQPTVVLFDRFLMEEQFGWRVTEYCPKAVRILDTEDLQSLRGARQLAHKEKRFFKLDDLQTDLSKREIASIYRCDLSLIISDYEEELLTHHFGVDPALLIHIPFMLDLSKWENKTVTFEQRQHFITIGNLRHAPNWDSLLFLQEIWPLIRKELPKAELHIYGAYTPPKATSLNNPKLGFLIKDRASNVQQIMENVRVCLSPLRFGAGIKGKFIDAMLAGTPCVTTPIGSEGMHGNHEWPGLISSTAIEIAEKAIQLYKSEKLWQLKHQQCSQLLRSRYNKEDIGRQLIARIEKLIVNIEKHRKKNFIGSMLNFHTQRSTKFMSKWIEEKNKNN